MTLPELNTLLGQVLPGKVVYHAWPVGEAPDLPFICYFSTGSDNFAADNIVYHSQTPVRIELYEASKSLTTEGALESALTAAGIYWDRDESYLDAEKCYLIIYEVNIYA